MLAVLPQFRRSLIVVVEFLPFMFNRRGHPRADQIAASMGLPAAADDHEDSIVALRYLGESVLVHNEGSLSDLDT